MILKTEVSFILRFEPTKIQYLNFFFINLSVGLNYKHLFLSVPTSSVNVCIGLLGFL